jgi:flagellar protein FlaG
MEPIQGTTASYQGSGNAVDKTSGAQKSAEQTAPVQPVSGAGDNPQQPEKTAGTSSEKTGTQEKASDSSIKKAVDEINRKSSSTEAIFGYHEGTNRVTIKIVDKNTKEVKREYPAEKTLDMIQKIWEMAGLMVDEKR